MVTQEVTVQRLEEGIKYSPSEYFFRDIDRYLRFKYPTKMFTDVNFEVNEEGEPYWVATVVTKKVGLFGGEDAIGAVLVNAVTGESTYYDVADVPQWVDRVYTAELILEQYNVVATGTSVSSCIESYEQLLAENGISIEGGTAPATSEVSGVVEDIRSSVINGNSVYYIKLEGEDVYYALSAADSPEAAILNVGDRVSFHAAESEEAIIQASGLELS